MQRRSLVCHRNLQVSLWWVMNETNKETCKYRMSNWCKNKQNHNQSNGSNGKRDKAIDSTAIEDKMRSRTKWDKAVTSYYAMKQEFMHRREVSISTKLEAYKTIFRPILTYDCKSWKLTRSMKSKIHVAKIKYLRRKLEIVRMDKVRNERIREMLEIVPILQFV